MPAEVTKKLFTVDEYYRMVDAGILTKRDRVELIEGEILQMSPIGRRHAACVNRANELFVLRFNEKAIVSGQHPLRLDKYNVPQPDIAVLKRRADYYASRLPTPDDTFFVVEVSDTTLRYDTNVKLPIYARSGIAEVWIANLQEDLLLVCRDPDAKTYKIQLTLRRGDPISPLAFSEVVFKVEDLLGSGI
jgi:Uma2 family endonuclease